jgi:hypothetical protein
VSWSAGSCRSNSMERLERLKARWASEVPSGPNGGRRRLREPPGGSTAVTSAPRTASR